MKTGKYIARTLAVWIAVTAANVTAGTWYVSTNGNGSAGTDWDTAYTNVQHALDDAISGDTIYVAGQTFDIEAEISWTTADLTMIGGYAATNAADQPGPSDPEQWPTVFHRSLASQYRVLYINGADNSALENIRLTGGQAEASGVGTHPAGSGVRIDNSDGVLLSGCIIDDNTVVIDGNNSTILGAGLYASGSTLTLTNCRLEGNVANHQRYHDNASAKGGAIWSDGTLTIQDSRIYNNVALAEYKSLGAGGGIYFEGTSLNLKNVLLAGNASGYTNSGAGLHVASGAVVLNNCTVADNVGNGIRQMAGTVALTNSIVWGNWTDIGDSGGVTVSSSSVGDTDYGDDNIMDDPLFEYGYYLASGSPCVDEGSGTVAAAGLTGYTTRTDGTDDTDPVDMGYHYASGFDLTYADLYVAPAPEGSDGNTGTSWAQAFATLTKALQTARDGTRIHVKAGNYTEGNGEIFPLTFPEKPGVQLLGNSATETVLDAGGSGTYVLSMASSHRAVLKNLALVGTDLDSGFGSFNNVLNAGGLFIKNSQGILLSGCIISNNVIRNTRIRNTIRGGGAYIADSQVTLADCRIRDNHSLNLDDQRGCYSYGGGIWGNGKLAIRNSVIGSNTAGSFEGYSDNANSILCFGGGLYFEGFDLDLKNVLLANNLSTGDGGGLFVDAGDAELVNCTIGDNNGQGVNNTGGTFSTFNSILWGNGIDSTGTVTIAYSIIENSTDYTDGGNNLSDDPLFVDASGGNYRLQTGSPAIDQGLNQPWMTDATDLDGMPRIMKGIVDMGCYEVIPPTGSLFIIR